ncbi:L-amino-acid oxidase [Xylariales sp. AK1849]|nr:L-amino-acid oxidase [Xylariales sp. AK1849]
MWLTDEAHAKIADCTTYSSMELREAYEYGVLIQYDVRIPLMSLSHSSRHSYAQHISGQSAGSKTSRLVWVIPSDAQIGGCISAWDDARTLIGRSEAQQFRPTKRTLGKRGPNSINMTDAAEFSTLGAWFDGVALLNGKSSSAVDGQAAKSKKIAIVGGGMSGLMTFLVLHQSGITNLKIMEATQRLGGRVHIAYLSGGPFDYSYQEMGPMRLPATVTYSNETYNITDHQMVFRLADKMNHINNYNKNFSIDFIPWLQSSLPPTVGQVAQNVSLKVTSEVDASTETRETTVDSLLSNETFLIELATNMHKADKDFIVNGLNGIGNGDTWSEFSFRPTTLMPHSIMEISSVVAVLLIRSGNRRSVGCISQPPPGNQSMEDRTQPATFVFPSTGRQRNSHGAKIERVEWLEDVKKVKLQWRGHCSDREFQDATFDCTVMALPFPMIKKWRLPSLPTTIASAIDKVTLVPACKGLRWASVPEDEHVQYVLEAMTEIHGQVAYDDHTGKYSRRCWFLDPNECGSWSSPTIGQHQLYIPEYFKTYNNMIFVGEQTSYTHGCIASALESGVRGAVQLLLELGLVDEAKFAVDKWTARWINVIQRAFVPSLAFSSHQAIFWPAGDQIPLYSPNANNMCEQHQFHQVQCGQCQGYHGEKIYTNLQHICRYATQRGAFGACGRLKAIEIRRSGWKDCANCHNRHEVRSIWLGGQT